MVRLYLTNDSYPELRDVGPPWVRTATWWRAIRRAARHADFWVFVSAQVALLGVFFGAGMLVTGLTDSAAGNVAATGLAAAWLGAMGYLQVSWGGDMMRRHLRAVSETARWACPRCGQSLFGHRGGGTAAVQCPECAAEVERALFEPPFRVPRRFRAFPPWRRSG